MHNVGGSRNDDIAAQLHAFTKAGAIKPKGEEKKTSGTSLGSKIKNFLSPSVAKVKTEMVKAEKKIEMMSSGDSIQALQGKLKEKGLDKAAGRLSNGKAHGDTLTKTVFYASQLIYDEKNNISKKDMKKVLDTMLPGWEKAEGKHAKEIQGAFIARYAK
jgi:hypothetical protein